MIFDNRVKHLRSEQTCVVSFDCVVETGVIEDTEVVVQIGRRRAAFHHEAIVMQLE